MKRFIKFVIVGGSGTLVNFGILYGLTSAGLIYWVSAIIAIFIAMTCNYTFNNFWTFKDLKKTGIQFFSGWWRYAIVSFIGDGMYLGMMILFVEKCGFYYMVSAAISMLIVAVIRYLIIRKLVWRISDVNVA